MRIDDDADIDIDAQLANDVARPAPVASGGRRVEWLSGFVLLGGLPERARRHCQRPCRMDELMMMRHSMLERSSTSGIDRGVDWRLEQVLAHCHKAPAMRVHARVRVKGTGSAGRSVVLVGARACGRGSVGIIGLVPATTFA